MKKILFVHHATVSVGAGLSALHIVENIPREKYNVVVCLPDGQGDLKEKFNQMKDVQVRCVFQKVCSYTHVNGYHYPVFSISHLHNVLELLDSRKKLEKVLQEEKPDIVIVNSMTLFWAGKYARKMGAKTICFHRETYCRGLLGIRTYYIKKRLNKDFDKIAFLSEYDMRQTGKECDKYVRITDKVDNAIYEKLNKEECKEELGLPEKKLILYTGGISALKGIKILLRSILHLETDAKIVILQYSSSYPKLNGFRGMRQKFRRICGKDVQYWAERYIKKKCLEDKLILRGRTDTVEKYFIACDLAVFPSQEPHQARPIYEAGVAKCPIIVSDFENTREFLDEKNGWCVQHNDARAWAAVCDNVLCGGEEIACKVQENYKKVMSVNRLQDLRKELQNLLQNME